MDTKQGGVFIAPPHLIRRVRETLDKTGRVIKKVVQEPRVVKEKKKA